MRVPRPGLPGLLALVASACATTTSAGGSHGGGGAERELRSEAYPGRCALLGIEKSRREGRTDTDSVQLVARYAPDDEGTPFGLAFEVQEERMHELRAHLQSHSSVLCRPERSASPDEVTVYEVQVPAFEGQQGQYVAPTPEELATPPVPVAAPESDAESDPE